MSEEAQRVYLVKKMQMRDGEFGFPIAYPNQTFDKPKNAVYGEFHIIAGSKPVIAGGAGQGKVLARRVGMVQLTIWVPNEKGTSAATKAADIFKSIFQLKVGRDTAQSTYKFKLIEPYNPQTKAGWECFVYRVSFTRDSREEVEIGA